MLRPERYPALNACKESRQETLMVSERRANTEPPQKQVLLLEIPSEAFFDPLQDIASFDIPH
jgi:hypothetical protein